jgi:hypothetical protein
LKFPQQRLPNIRLGPGDTVPFNAGVRVASAGEAGVADLLTVILIDVWGVGVPGR